MSMQPAVTAAIAEAAAAIPEAEPTVDGRARLREMFDHHHNVVWRTLRRYGLDAEAAADVGQQAFLVAVERIADIRFGSERAFLLGAALRLAHKHRRNVARSPLGDGLEERAPQPARAESHAMTLELLDRVLSQLDASLVEVFVLFDVEGFSTREIASALAIPEGTVASRLRRAREEFRAVTRRLQLVLDREEGGS
jgi:RNA polymerase sigma-70 factor (ECF subfamily)